MVLSHSVSSNRQNCSFSHIEQIMTCIVFQIVESLVNFSVCCFFRNCGCLFCCACFLPFLLSWIITFSHSLCLVVPNLNCSRPLIKLSITWRKNGVPVSSGLSDFNRRLTVLSPALSDAGYYECEAVLRSSSVPSVSAGAYLHVQGGKHTATVEKSFWTPCACVKNRSGSPVYFRAESSTHHLLHLLYLLNLEKHLEYKNHSCLLYFLLFFFFANSFISAQRPWNHRASFQVFFSSKLNFWEIGFTYFFWQYTAKFLPFVCVSQMRPSFQKHKKCKTLFLFWGCYKVHEIIDIPSEIPVAQPLEIILKLWLLFLFFSFFSFL